MQSIFKGPLGTFHNLNLLINYHVKIGIFIFWGTRREENPDELRKFYLGFIAYLRGRLMKIY